MYFYFIFVGFGFGGEGCLGKVKEEEEEEEGGSIVGSGGVCLSLSSDKQTVLIWHFLHPSQLTVSGS